MKYLNFKEIYIYRYFLKQLIKKNLTIAYKQTVLGPSLQIISPLLQTGLFSILFGSIIKVQTDNVPIYLYYIVPMTLWSFFKLSVIKTSNIFAHNMDLFKAFYFPRILVSLAAIIENFIIYLIQLLILILIILFFKLITPDIKLSILNLLLSFFSIVLLFFLSLSIGLLISSLSFKYRDLNYFIDYGLQILFFGTPILYSLNSVSVNYHWLFHFNPIYYPFMFYKGLLLNTQMPDLQFLFSGLLISSILFYFSMLLFNHACKVCDDYN
jgi:lipopolysaccharide transport system permease protein